MASALHSRATGRPEARAAGTRPVSRAHARSHANWQVPRIRGAHRAQLELRGEWAGDLPVL
eukprot:884752-Prymnesium_polylepis.1